MKINDFIEAAHCTFLCDFSEGFEVNIVCFPVVVGFVLIEMKDVVVASGAEALGVESHFSFAPLASFRLWFPLQFFVTCVAKTLGMMFFLGFAIDTLFYHHRLFLFRKKKFPGSRKTIFPKLCFDLLMARNRAFAY